MTPNSNIIPSPTTVFRNVFTDIQEEWKNTTEEERKFIEQNKDYIDANNRYQQQFNAFLLEVMGVQFLNSPYGKSAEEVLLTLKKVKGNFQKETIENINSIKKQNEELLKQIAELRKEAGYDKRQRDII